jgi:hypothetical protein
VSLDDVGSEATKKRLAARGNLIAEKKPSPPCSRSVSAKNEIKGGLLVQVAEGDVVADARDDEGEIRAVRSVRDFESVVVVVENAAETERVLRVALPDRSIEREAEDTGDNEISKDRVPDIGGTEFEMDSLTLLE